MLSGKHHRVNTPRDNAFRANYKENFPNWSLDVYAVQGYDAAQMLDAGLKAVNGDVSKKDAMRDAIRTAKIDSPRGELTRSEERRGGKEGVSTCSTRWLPDHKKKKK